MVGTDLKRFVSLVTNAYVRWCTALWVLKSEAAGRFLTVLRPPRRAFRWWEGYRRSNIEQTTNDIVAVRVSIVVQMESSL